MINGTRDLGVKQISKCVFRRKMIYRQDEAVYFLYYIQFDRISKELTDDAQKSLFISHIYKHELNLLTFNALS